MRSVEPGVGLIRLRSPNGLGVNVYVVDDHDGVALVDSGFGFTGQSLAQSLARAGWSLRDVSTVLVTHLHEDHVGGAIELRDAWAATVVVGDRSSEVLADWVGWYEARVDFATWMRQWLGPCDVLDAMEHARSSRIVTPTVAGPHRGLQTWQPVAIGAEVRVGTLRFVCIDARGHDPRHVAWLEPDRRWLFSGDVVLGVPTPITPLMDDDMGDYRRTLRRWARHLDVDWLLPGHGRPRQGFAEAVSTSLGFIRAVHEGAAHALRRGPVRLASLAQLGATRPDGTLDPRRAFVATVNSLAVLFELEQLGIVRRLDEPGCFEASRTVPGFDAMP